MGAVERHQLLSFAFEKKAAEGDHKQATTHAIGESGARARRCQGRGSRPVAGARKVFVAARDLPCPVDGGLMAFFDTLMEDLMGAKPEAEPVPAGLYNLRLDPELKNICRRAGLRLGGKKNEVLARIEMAWANDSPSGREAVRAALAIPARAGGSMMGSGSASGYDPRAAATFRSGSSSFSGFGHTVGAGAGAGGSGSVANSKLQCWCMRSSHGHLRNQSGPLVTCMQCDSQHHASCVNVPPMEAASKTDWSCAACRATWLDPFSPVVMTETIDSVTLSPGASPVTLQQYYIPGATMMQVSGSGPPNAAHIEFDLSAAVAFGLLGGTRRLELRSFLPNPSYGRTSHRWPLRTSIFVNMSSVGGVHQQPQVRRPPIRAEGPRCP